MYYVLASLPYIYCVMWCLNVRHEKSQAALLLSTFIIICFLFFNALFAAHEFNSTIHALEQLTKFFLCC